MRDDVIARLKEEFIPFAGNTNELQVSKWESPERTWFMQTIKDIHPGASKGVTAQGFYVVAPDGQGYVFSMHGRQRDEFMKLLDAGLAMYKKSPPKRVEIVTSPTKQWTRPKPQGTLVVRSISRIDPMPLNASDKNKSIGRDHFWIFPEDAKEILNQVGREFAMPAKLARRLARFHLLDNVRGEPTRWRYDNIQLLDIKMVRMSEGSFSFAGQFKISNMEGSGGTAKGTEGIISGTLKIDPKHRVATEFTAFVDAKAWGDHDNTSGAPKGKYPLKIAFRTIDDEIARSVPPQQSYFWGEYLDPTSSIRVPWP